MVNGELVEDSTLAVWMGGALCRECEKLTSFLPSQEQWEHSVNNGCNKALSKLSEAERVGAVVSALTMEMDHPLFNKLRFSGQMGSFGEADGSGKQRSQMFNVPGGRCVSICIIIWCGRKKINNQNIFYQYLFFYISPSILFLACNWWFNT